MTRRKSVCLKWTLVLVLIVLCPCVYSRPQEASVSTSTDNSVNEVTTETILRSPARDSEKVPPTSTDSNLSREVKTKTPLIGESIQVVASQLLQTPNNVTLKNVVSDTRVPPKIKNKIKTRNDDMDMIQENSHIGEAVPLTMEELESENKLGDEKHESSTSNEGISTWILLSNTGTNISTPTEPTKAEEPSKKKNSTSKNKNKKPQANKPSKRPIIGSTNKSDLVAGGSAINENVMNKLKDTVLTNVQKNKNTLIQKTTTTTTTSTTTTEPTTEALTTKLPTSEPSVSKITKTKKKNKNKVKTSTVAPKDNESAMLPMEAKEQEIELEVSTPPPTKKTKHTSTKKKTKTKKRKTAKPKPEETSVSVSDIKTSNKTKSVKTSKKPSTTNSSAISTQIYNYLSREVMPSVGVGMLGLASLVGIASYFFYPFATPVRRTLDVDKKDDLYVHNAEEYAHEGNGQAEEEMLGTVLAGMPAHAKQKLNPYAGQTVHTNRYPAKKEQDLRYRHGAALAGYTPNYNMRYPQQKTGLAHGAVYPEKSNYNPYTYETRHAQSTESKYAYEKGSSLSYTQAPAYSAAVEPIYAVPQTGPSGSSYSNEGSGSVVYGVKPSADSDFKPVYPYDSQFYAETTSSPVTYAPTSMYLGSNKDTDGQDDSQYAEETSGNEEIDNKFVVGNVPKELADNATPAVVPEHGPRHFRRKRRSIIKQERGLYIDDLLKPVSKQNKYVLMSNEIDDVPYSKSPLKESKISAEVENAPNEVLQNKVVESVSTAPITDIMSEKTTTSEDNILSEDLFTTNLTPTKNIKSSALNQLKNEQEVIAENVATTTESNLETTSNEPKANPTTVSESKNPVVTTTKKPYFSTKSPDLITYPPSNQESGIFSVLRRLFEFKYKLGLSILQTTSDSLNRYLHDLDTTTKKPRTRTLSKRWF